MCIIIIIIFLLLCSFLSDASTLTNEPDFSQDYDGKKIPDLKSIVECLFERIKQQVSACQ